jgi:hypothetical protein
MEQRSHTSSQAYSLLLRQTEGVAAEKARDAVQKQSYRTQAT